MAIEPAMKITPVRGLGARIILNISTMQDFNDSVSAQYETKNVYGRPDPILSYTSTTRTIKMSWLAYTHRNPFLLKAVKTLQRLLYASYARVGSNHILKDPPLFKVQFGTANFGDDGQKATGFKKGHYMGVKRVYGVFDTFEVKVYDGKVYALGDSKSRSFIPDRVGIDATLTVLHHYNPGFLGKESVMAEAEDTSGRTETPTSTEVTEATSFPAEDLSGDHDPGGPPTTTPAATADLVAPTDPASVLGDAAEARAMESTPAASTPTSALTPSPGSSLE